MKNYLNGLNGMIVSGANNRAGRKAMREIQEANEARRGIIYYRPSQIEAFFDESVPIESLIVSGGSNNLRIRSVTRAIECAFLQGYSILVIHAGNIELEQCLVNYFGSSLMCIINRNNAIYDPFYRATNDEISRLVLSSSQRKHRISSSGRYYLNGISDYIRCNHKLPRCYMFVKCPHQTLIDRVNSAENKGIISPSEARNVVSQITQGQADRGSIESFFHDLSIQGGAVLSSKNNAAYATNLVNESNNHRILSVDVQSNSNSILMNLLVHETESIVSQGKKMMIIIDGINVHASEALMNYVNHNGGGTSAVISSEDVYSEFGGIDNEFFSFVGKCSKLIISKHSSAYSSQKVSDAIGSYDKQEISDSISRNVNYYGRWGVGSSQTLNVSTKRENRVKSEEIQRMNNDEVVILDKNTGELSFSPIV